MSKHPSQNARYVKKLEAKLARLESLQDVYETEAEMLDSLLQRVGFENGLLSLKEAAEELLLCELDNE